MSVCGCSFKYFVQAWRFLYNVYMNKNFESSIKLNLARNCLRYAIRAYEIKEMYIPYYICPVIYKVLREEGCRIKIYHIDEKFFPICNFGEKDFILYPNYFGVCFRNVKKLSSLYKNLIVDNAQAFYSPHMGMVSFTSARKFFDVSDGAYLFGSKKISQKFTKDDSMTRYSALFSENGSYSFERFCTNEELLNKAFIHFSALGDLGYKSSKYDNYTMANIGSELMKTSILRMIYQQNDDTSPQEMMGMLNNIMSEENLACVSQKLGLDKFVVADEEALAKYPEKILSRTLKAYVAAIALDDKDYGMDDAFSFVSKIFQSSIE